MKLSSNLKPVVDGCVVHELYTTLLSTMIVLGIFILHAGLFLIADSNDHRRDHSSYNIANMLPFSGYDYENRT
jgi:hypothetical protein